MIGVGKRVKVMTGDHAGIIGEVISCGIILTKLGAVASADIRLKDGSVIVTIAAVLEVVRPGK